MCCLGCLRQNDASPGLGGGLYIKRWQAEVHVYVGIHLETKGAERKPSFMLLEVGRVLVVVSQLPA